jgi:hypothetical protein
MVALNSAWTAQNGINIANAAINLGSGTTLNGSELIDLMTNLFN